MYSSPRLARRCAAPVVEVERHDPVRLALVEVDRAGVDMTRRRGCRRRCRPACRRRRRCGTRPRRARPQPDAGGRRARPLQRRARSRSRSRSSTHELDGRRRRGVAPPPLVGGRQRRLVGGAGQVRHSTTGSSRLTTAGSGGRVKTSRGGPSATGRAGRSPATSTASERCWCDPARPACCHIEATCRGSRRAHRRRAHRRRCRARGRRWPPRRQPAREELGLDLAPLVGEVAAAVGAAPGSRGRRRACVGRRPATISVALPAATEGDGAPPASTSAAVAPPPRRSVSPARRCPRRAAVGSTARTAARRVVTRRPRPGAPTRRTAPRPERAGSPIGGRREDEFGMRAVAAQSRRSRRSTCATWVPKMPRKTCSSSTTT